MEATQSYKKRCNSLSLPRQTHQIPQAPPLDTNNNVRVGVSMTDMQTPIES